MSERKQNNEIVYDEKEYKKIREYMSSFMSKYFPERFPDQNEFYNKTKKDKDKIFDAFKTYEKDLLNLIKKEKDVAIPIEGFFKDVYSTTVFLELFCQLNDLEEEQEILYKKHVVPIRDILEKMFKKRL